MVEEFTPLSNENPGVLLRHVNDYPGRKIDIPRFSDTGRRFLKICGFTDAVALCAALDTDVDALGFVFAPQSIRHLTLLQAQKLLRLVHREDIVPVGVFLDNPIEEILHIAQLTGISTVQVHDLTGTDQVNQLHKAELQVIRAISAHMEPDPLGADMLLIDSTTAGSGTSWDWQQISAPVPWILAGGLNPHNVQTALEQAHPWGVDVSSGIESSRGMKDTKLIQQFVTSMRESDAHQQ